MKKIGINQALRKARVHAIKGQAGQARRLYTAILQFDPGNAEARRELRRLDGGSDAKPGTGAGGNDRLRGLFRAGNYRAAYDEAVQRMELAGETPDLCNIAGAAAVGMGDMAKARDAFARWASLDPPQAEAFLKLGGAEMQSGNPAAAIRAYRKALEIEPGHVRARHNLARSQQKTGMLEEAVESYRLVVKADPAIHLAWYRLGNTLKNLRRQDEALECYRRALELKPGSARIKVAMLHQQRRMGDWSTTEEIASSCASLGTRGDPVAPFPMLAMEDDPQNQLLRSRNFYTKTMRRDPAGPLPARPRSRPQRLNIGYFSADFHAHPGMVLMVGLLERHDRQRFSVTAYSFGPDRDDQMRRRVAAAVDRFVDIRDLSDDDAWQLARRHDLHVALNRNGYTKNERSGIFARRAAPLQVNYLGFPSTTGADCMDYMVADRVTVPREERRHYSENMIYMPHAYQPNDDRRAIAETETRRSDWGLPEDGFVFCCFNNSHKITPREYDIWMRLLRQKENSVLWLLQDNPWQQANLRREAQARGVCGERIVFAERAPLDKHLERHSHADLFLDTFCYNAHTTASDALWTGLPLVTRQGRQFAARVASSLLHAVGLPELVAGSDAQYERLALELAHDPGKLQDIGARLAASRSASPLFDTAAYARDFETALDTAFQRHLDGLDPCDFDVVPAP